MTMRTLTADQLDELRANPNVARCEGKTITYSARFKTLAVSRYETDGLTSTEIFREAGFDLDAIGRHTPKECLRRWRRTQKARGIGALSVEHRGRNGGRPRTVGLTDRDRIERLEAKVAYLKAENDFLAKLRAKRKG